MPNNNLLMLPTYIVKAALLFVGKGDVRTYLNGLHITVIDGDVAVTAGDGSTLFRHEIKDYAGIEDIDLIIPGYIAKLALWLAQKNKYDFIPLNIDENFFGEVGFRRKDEKYPVFDLEQLRSGSQNDETTYQLELLNRLQKASNLMGGSWLILPKIQYFEHCAILQIDPHTYAVAMGSHVDAED